MITLKHWDREVLVDSETADWCGRKEDGSLDPDQPTPERSWTRLIQFQEFIDGVGQGEVVIDLHPSVTTPKDAENLEHLRDLLDGSCLSVLQNAKYDIPYFEKQGLYIRRFRDTMLLSQLLHAGKPFRHNLNEIMKREIGYDPYEGIGLQRITTEGYNHMYTFGDPGNPLPMMGANALPLNAKEACRIWTIQEIGRTKHRLQSSDWSVAELEEEQKLYCRMDVSQHFYDAWKSLERQIERMGMEDIADLEHQCIPAIVEMEKNGIKLNLTKWKAYLAEKRIALAEVEEKIRKFVDPVTQDIYADKFMITLKRKKPAEAVEERWSKGKPARFSKADPTKQLAPAEPPVLLRAAVPAQAQGELSARQGTPALFPFYDVSQSLLDAQDGDYRVGAIVWQELGQITSPENYKKHQFNISSAEQMRMLVNDLLGIDYRDTAGDPLKDKLKFGSKDVIALIQEVENRLNEATGTESLLIFQVKELLQDHKTAQVLRTIIKTFGDSYMAFADSNGYIRSHFMTTATKTGRMSSNTPNIQNLTRSLQALLFCNENDEAMVSVDYSNMEGRTLFFVTGQMDIYDLLTNGMDLHSMSASFKLNIPYEEIVERVPGESKDTVKDKYKKDRQDSKPVTFSPPFGCGPKKIGELLKCDYREAKAFLARYWAKYPIMKKTLDKQFESAVNFGYVTDLAFGRKRYFKIMPEDQAELDFGKPRMDVLGKWKSEGYNYCAQAGGATCLKVALIMFMQWLERHPETGTILRVVIHDSMKVTCKKEYAFFVGNEIKRIMEVAAEYVLGGARVPADVEIYFNKTAPRSFDEAAA